MSRVNKFLALKLHPFLSHRFKKLTNDEFNECIEFINSNLNLSDSDFSAALNTWKLDQPKTKNHNVMWSLICESLVK